MRSLSAEESAGLARQLGIRDIILVVNRVGNQAEVERIHQKTGKMTGFSQMVFLPYNPEIIHLEPAVSQILSGDAEFIRKVRNLAKAVM